MESVNQSLLSVEEMYKIVNQLKKEYEPNTVKPWLHSLYILSNELHYLHLLYFNFRSEGDKLLNQVVDNVELLISCYKQDNGYIEYLQDTIKEFKEKCDDKMLTVLEAVTVASAAQDNLSNLQIEYSREHSTLTETEYYLKEQLNDLNYKAPAAEAKFSNLEKEMLKRLGKHRVDPATIALANELTSREQDYEKEIKTLEDKGKELEQQIWGLKTLRRHICCILSIQNCKLS